MGQFSTAYTQGCYLYSAQRYRVPVESRCFQGSSCERAHRHRFKATWVWLEIVGCRLVVQCCGPTRNDTPLLSLTAVPRANSEAANTKTATKAAFRSRDASPALPHQCPLCPCRFGDSCSATVMKRVDFSTHAVRRRRSASGNIQPIVRDAPSRHSDAYREHQGRHEQKHKGKLAQRLLSANQDRKGGDEHGLPSRKMQ